MTSFIWSISRSIGGSPRHQGHPCGDSQVGGPRFTGQRHNGLHVQNRSPHNQIHHLQSSSSSSPCNGYIGPNAYAVLCLQNHLTGASSPCGSCCRVPVALPFGEPPCIVESKARRPARCRVPGPTTQFPGPERLCLIDGIALHCCCVMGEGSDVSLVDTHTQSADLFLYIFFWLIANGLKLVAPAAR